MNFNLSDMLHIMIAQIKIVHRMQFGMKSGCIVSNIFVSVKSDLLIYN